MIMTRNGRLTSLQNLCFTPNRSAIAIAIGLTLGTLSAPTLAQATNPFAVDGATAYVSVAGLTSRVTGPDSDGDGIPNQVDLDDDNDGITDVIEGAVDNDGDGFPDDGSVDTDSDGAPDYLDLDSDNDGILDNLEARTDRDAVIALDQNPNGAIDIGISVGSNGLADVIETSTDSGELLYPVPDTDQDGIPDFRDLDSDNDGIYDVVEAGGVDSDTDGRLDGFYDEDGKGVDDTVQSTSLPIFDTDGDGTLDFRDLDSDGDTISDQVESGGNASQPTDTDGDGAPDYRETDSDGDGIGDAQEGDSQSVASDDDGAGAGDESSDGDSTYVADDGRPDRDDDGIANQDDLDDDNDTILDSEEGIIDADGDGFADANSRDSDGDGTPDGYDLDSDNDGILDILEGRLDEGTIADLDPLNIGAVRISVDVGANGIPDVIESSPESGFISQSLFDTDNDGTPDYIDVDSDNDGISDLVEAGGVDADGDGRIDNFVDVDTKGVDDAVQASSLPRFDTDGDGIRDYRDTDSDGDTIADSVESGDNYAMPTDTDGDGASDYREQDSDNDTVADSIEVGPDTSNPVDTNGDGTPDFQDDTVQYTGNGTSTPVQTDPQTGDQDGDGLSDAIDQDDDNDGIPDIAEGSGDSDSDGVANSMDLDSDNDGVLDSVERAIDTDNDGVPNYLDLDSDNDGVYDALESGQTSVSSSGRLATAGAVDANGLASGAGVTPVDTDGDSIVDMRDLDSDNDGLLDLQEAGFIDSDLDTRIDNFTDANLDGASDSLPSSAVQLRDTDRDRIADIRDLDSDQDSLSDLLENFGYGIDLDNNGQVDNFIDNNRDGLDDNVAAQLSHLADTDGDGIPNSIDLDSDGDGVSDITESGGVDTDGDSLNDQLADSDGDGIPDQNDVDQTGGNDVDNDSIDDSVDSDFVAGTDTDGDGIVDSADPDVDGNGFVGPVDDDADGLSQGSPVSLPDADGDGTADLDQGQALSDFIETGLGGTGFGCTIGPVGSTSKTDPMLAFLFAGSLMFLGLRRRKQMQRNATLAVIASATALSGCGVLDIGGRDSNFENRVYVGLGLLGSQLEPDTDGVAGTSVDSSQSAGLSGMVGFDINNRFSVEGHLATLGEATLDPAGSIGYNVGGISGVMYGLNDYRDRSRREGFGVYGRLGLGAMANSAEVVDFRRVNDVHLLVGAGLEYGMTNGLGLRAELVAHETDAKYVQLGVVYRFGELRRSGSRPEPVVEKINVDPIVTAVPTPEPVVPAPRDLVVPSVIDNADNDSDGVTGDADVCPDTAPGVPVGEDGCALIGGVVDGVEFEPSSDQLTDEAILALTSVAQTLNEYPDLRITVEAHTDNLGDAADNLQLSKRRAVAVARFLVDQGVSGSRLKPQAFGESRPQTSNVTAEGRKANRRVELSIID